MRVAITLDQLGLLAPHISDRYRAAFLSGLGALDAHAITATPLRVAHFFAQVLHESGAFTCEFENLDYSPERLSVVWPSRFRPAGALDPAAYAHDERKLANAVYGQRMGNQAPDDGYTYRGRGLLQMTGRDNYAQATTMLRRATPAAPDFTTEPDAVIDPHWCVPVAAAVWEAKGCNPLADADAAEAVTRRLNGGVIGLAERMAWTRRAKAIWR